MTEKENIQTALNVLFANAVHLVPSNIVKGTKESFHWELFITDKMIDGILEFLRNSKNCECKSCGCNEENRIWCMKHYDEMMDDMNSSFTPSP